MFVARRDSFCSSVSLLSIGSIISVNMSDRQQNKCHNMKSAALKCYMFLEAAVLGVVWMLKSQGFARKGATPIQEAGSMTY